MKNVESASVATALAKCDFLFQVDYIIKNKKKPPGPSLPSKELWELKRHYDSLLQCLLGALKPSHITPLHIWLAPHHPHLHSWAVIFIIVKIASSISFC